MGLSGNGWQTVGEAGQEGVILFGWEQVVVDFGKQIGIV